jgi:2-dehydro-3-deoxyphosphogluconate aldolase/(4S)-4-hydroxy-2-oxoglutarate aldolase
MVGGSWLTPADALAQGDWARITRLAREATELAPPLAPQNR